VTKDVAVTRAVEAGSTRTFTRRRLQSTHPSFDFGCAFRADIVQKP
jgi:hypothetical protein